MADAKPDEAKATATTEPEPKKPSATHTELQTLQSAGRGKLLLLAGILVVALVGAGWAFLSGGGNGNPENPGKVLVVTTDGGQKTFLVSLGFEADAQTFENLESKAMQEVPDLETKGVRAIMELADRFGYGYVVFESPQNFDFSELEALGGPPKFEDGDLYAAVSVGDLAAPHKVTTDYGMLGALFEQDRLAELLPPEQPPTVEAVQLRDQLRDAIDRHTDPPLMSPRRYLRF